MANIDPKSKPPIVLTIAGSDCSGGAGIQADIKTINQFGGFAMSVVTAVTAQNSAEVSNVYVLKADIVSAQITAVLTDYPIKAIKIGMIGSADIAKVCAKAIASQLEGFPHIPIIIDTPLMATSGFELGNEHVLAAYKQHLFPIAHLITPNIDEAAKILNCQPAVSAKQMQQQAKALLALGSKAVLLKGGHLHANTSAKEQEAIDVLYDGTNQLMLRAPWVKVENTHGTGCALSSAIAVNMAQGKPLHQAVQLAKQWLTNCLKNSHNMRLGGSSGPVNTSISPKFAD